MWNQLFITLGLMDAFVLRGCTRVSHGIQRWCGWNAYRQAVTVFTWWLVVAALDAADFWLPDMFPKRNTGVIILAIIFFSTIWIGGLRARCRRAAVDFDRCGGDVLPTTVLEIAEYSFTPVRTWFLITCLPATSTIVANVVTGHWLPALSVSGVHAIAMAFYLMAVRPLPPGKTRFQELADDIRAGLQPHLPIRDGGPS